MVPPLHSASLRAVLVTGRRDRTRRQGPRRRAATPAEGSRRTETPEGRRGRKVTQPGRSLRRWRRPQGRAQRPAGTSRDEPAGVRRPGPRRPRGPSRSTGSVGRPQGRKAKSGATKAEGRREANRPPAIRLSTERGGRLGATEPEEPTGTERFGGRRPEAPRALFRAGYCATVWAHDGP